MFMLHTETSKACFGGFDVAQTMDDVVALLFFIL